MSSFLPSLVGAVVGDLVSSARFTAANVAGMIGAEMLDRLLKKRREGVQTILLAELKSGAARLGESDVEESAAVHESVETRLTYQKERDRLLLRTIQERGKALSRKCFADETIVATKHMEIQELRCPLPG